MCTYYWPNLAARRKSVEEEADRAMKMSAVCQASVKKGGWFLVADFFSHGPSARVSPINSPYWRELFHVVIRHVLGSIDTLQFDEIVFDPTL